MEEILASIRNMIADEPAKQTTSKAPQPALTPAPQIVYSGDCRALGPRRNSKGRAGAKTASAPAHALTSTGTMHL